MVLAIPSNTERVPPFGMLLGLVPLEAMAFFLCIRTHKSANSLVLSLPTVVQSIRDGDSLCCCVSIFLVFPVGPIYLWLCRSCSVSRHFFRKKSSISRQRFGVCMEETGSGSSQVAILNSPLQRSLIFHRLNFSYFKRCLGKVKQKLMGGILN